MVQQEEINTAERTKISERVLTSETLKCNHEASKGKRKAGKSLSARRHVGKKTGHCCLNKEDHEQRKWVALMNKEKMVDSP